MHVECLGNLINAHFKAFFYMITAKKAEGWVTRGQLNAALKAHKFKPLSKAALEGKKGGLPNTKKPLPYKA